MRKTTKDRSAPQGFGAPKPPRKAKPKKKADWHPVPSTSQANDSKTGADQQEMTYREQILEELRAAGYRVIEAPPVDPKRCQLFRALAEAFAQGNHNPPELQIIKDSLPSPPSVPHD